MSDLALPGVAAARPARVWQPMELARSPLLHQGFRTQQWALSSSRGFWPQEVPTMPTSGRRASTAEHLNKSGPAGALAALPMPDESDVDLKSESVQQLSEELLESVRAQAYAKGAADCRVSLQAEMAAQLEALQAQDKSILEALEAAFERLQRSPQDYFEPLKRLALHLAEQLVLAELGLDGKAIERLVQRCVDDLSTHDESMILVELNPADLPLLEALREKLGLNRSQVLKLRANPSLLPGSARASANDAIVQDLIENQLAEFAKALGVDEARWKSSSAFESERLAARHAGGLRGVEDASPRMAGPVPVTETDFLDQQSEPDADDV